MEIYYQVRILPPIPRNCLSEDDLHRLAESGFVPEERESTEDQVRFMAPMYVPNNTDRKFEFINARGTYIISSTENTFHGLLTRIMEKAGLHYLYLTEIDQFFWR